MLVVGSQGVRGINVGFRCGRIGCRDRRKLAQRFCKVVVGIDPLSSLTSALTIAFDRAVDRAREFAEETPRNRFLPPYLIQDAVYAFAARSGVRASRRRAQIVAETAAGRSATVPVRTQARSNPATYFFVSARVR
jgi:nucleoside-diphosphate-sugar epimerase